MRTYRQTDKKLPPLQAVHSPREPEKAIAQCELIAWTDGAKLHSLQQASEILTAELGPNYSVAQLRRRIKQGLLGHAGAIWIYDGSYKINIHAFLQWRIDNPDEKALKDRLKGR